MTAWFASVATGAVMAMAPVMASAQTGPALAEARGRMACGAGTLVSATYVGGGMLRVTCREPSSENQSNSPSDSALTGTGLTAPVAGAIIATVLLVAIAGGGDDESSTTTTTTTTTTGNGGVASR